LKAIYPILVDFIEITEKVELVLLGIITCFYSKGGMLRIKAEFSAKKSVRNTLVFEVGNLRDEERYFPGLSFSSPEVFPWDFPDLFFVNRFETAGPE
jgi:hypothetical protein